MRTPSVRANSDSHPPSGPGKENAGPARPETVRPRWNSETGELWLGDRLVKRFRQSAECQRCILDAFEAKGWPERIDDPLPPTDGVAPRDRLHDAIKLLNRCQKEARLHFGGDGTGRGVLWRGPAGPAKAKRKRKKNKKG